MAATIGLQKKTGPKGPVFYWMNNASFKTKSPDKEYPAHSAPFQINQRRQPTLQMIQEKEYPAALKRHEFFAEFVALAQH